MSKKILVTKEWHKQAMLAMDSEKENSAFIHGLRDFVLVHLDTSQQLKLEKEIDAYIEIFEARNK